MLRYAEKTFGLLTRLGSLIDSRPRPQIPPGSIALSLFIMLLARLGSLNALEQTRGQRFWNRLLAGRRQPSADTLARVSAHFDPSDIRRENAHLYRRLKRNKALPAPPHGLIALVIDGHEAMASYRRKCSACLLHVFYARNLKPAVRRRATLQHVGRQISADLCVCAFAPT